MPFGHEGLTFKLSLVPHQRYLKCSSKKKGDFEKCFGTLKGIFSH